MYINVQNTHLVFIGESNMHNLQKTITSALFAHMHLLNCNLHYLHIAFYPEPKVVCANYATTTLNTKKVCVVLFGYSPNRIATIIFPFAGLAVPAYPNRIELVHGLLYQFGVVSEDASLEIARSIAFHADACACEIGAADVGYLSVKDQDLEMNPRTKRPLQAIKQGGVFVEVLSKCRAWLLGVDEPYLHSFFDELSQDCKEWLSLGADLDIQVLDVGRANPKASRDFGNTGEDFGVMGCARDEFQHGYCCLFSNAKIT